MRAHLLFLQPFSPTSRDALACVEDCLCNQGAGIKSLPAPEFPPVSQPSYIALRASSASLIVHHTSLYSLIRHHSATHNSYTFDSLAYDSQNRDTNQHPNYDVINFKPVFKSLLCSKCLIMIKELKGLAIARRSFLHSLVQPSAYYIRSRKV